MPLFEPTKEGIERCKSSIESAKRKISYYQQKLFEEEQSLEFYERWLKELLEEYKEG